MHESHEHPQHERASAPAASPRPGAFAPPRLELPRFQFSTPTTLARQADAPVTRAAAAPPAPPAPPAHRSPAPAAPRAPQLFAHPPRAPYAAPGAMAAPAPLTAPIAAPAAPVPYTPAPAYQYSATAMQQPVAVAMAPAAAPAPAPAPVASRIPNLNATSPAPVAWQQPAPAPERSWLQRITPVHMGAILVLVLVAMVVTAGPASMHAKPTRLPAVVSGGGTGDVPLPPRAGATATAAAAGVGARARASAARPTKARAIAPRTGSAPAGRMLRVGSATVPARVRAGGIPSPAAAANLAVTGGGRAPVGQTGAIRMDGIPSPAAAEALGPQQLPFRPSDGVTLPRAIGERDSHAVDAHYGTSTLPMEEPAAPVMTPGQSAAHAERQVTLNELTGGTSSDHPMPAAPAAGGYASAY